MAPAPAARTVEVPTELLANRQGRLVYMTLQEATRNASKILHVNTESGPVLFMPVVRQGIKLQTATPTPPQYNAMPNEQVNNGGHVPSVGHQGSSVTVTTLEQLLMQQNSLSQENVSLQQQLATYRQLFKNPEQLIAVARELGLRVNTN